jgi:hypothetical protein
MNGSITGHAPDQETNCDGEAMRCRGLTTTGGLAQDSRRRFRELLPAAAKLKLLRIIMSQPAPYNLSVQQLKQALAIKERIARLERKLAGILGGSSPALAVTQPRKRRMSAKGRAAIAAAAKARWARERAAKKK